MHGDFSKLNITRVGSNITFSSLKKIGAGILSSFQGLIRDFELRHHDAPVTGSIDALLLTMVLHAEYGGHTLGITDADLKTSDRDEFFSTIIGGKNPRNDVAVVSTRKLAPPQISTDSDYELFIGRTLKVSLHEIGHNFGLTDHAAYRRAPDGALCPMSRGEFNKFGYKGYVEAVVDGRGFRFCAECADFLKQAYGLRAAWTRLVSDRLSDTVSGPAWQAAVRAVEGDPGPDGVSGRDEPSNRRPAAHRGIPAPRRNPSQCPPGTCAN
jgi:predicted Zn-dependent protease